MSTKRERKTARELIKAVKRGHAYTVHDTEGEPQALVLPWKDWQALNQKLVQLERTYVAPGARHLSDPNERIPEDQWGQGEHATVLPDKVFTNAPNAIMATEADEDELQRYYGMTSEQLADEAEAGYDPARMKPYTRPDDTVNTDDDEGDFLNPSKIQ